MKELLTRKELAQALKVNIKTIYNWRQNGMPFKTIGGVIRFDPDEVTKWIEEQNNKAVE